jgi:hypothetical protein
MKNTPQVIEYVYYRPRRGFTHRLVLLVRELTRREPEGIVTISEKG